jgi:hypothetical protein
MADYEKALELLSEFYQAVDSIYGVYLDSTRGFYLVKKEHVAEQRWTIKMFEKTNPELANIEHLDMVPAMYGKGDPNKPGSVILHTCSQGELKARNEEGGANHRFIANMCLVSIYQYWEDHYRKQIATVLEKEKNDVESDIMGDIRRLRKSIIHHKGVALNEVRNCKVLRQFNEGDKIFIDKNIFEQVIHEIYAYINGLAREWDAELESKRPKDEQRE